MLMRGGTSKGAYFLASDLPEDPTERDALLLRVMGSPDPRQINGIGGGHPLTSKVAVISPSSPAATSSTPSSSTPMPSIGPSSTAPSSTAPSSTSAASTAPFSTGAPSTGPLSTAPSSTAGFSADVDYLFLQVHVDEPRVSAGQPCGNILAGVGPFAVERGLVPTTDPVTEVRVRMVNTGALAVVSVPTEHGRPVYTGSTVISGVPGRGARIVTEFRDTAGSLASALLPTGNIVDSLPDGPRTQTTTLIDNGMPVVLMAAADFGLTGYESPAELESRPDLSKHIERLRLVAGDLMGLGDVSAMTVPKMCLTAPPRDGGDVCTRMFIPHRVHTGIGILAAVTVATAVAMRESTAVAMRGSGAGRTVRIEHPTGYLDVVVDLGAGRSAVVSTARPLLDGHVYPYEELPA
ncbi:PrpF domain-containing protein [Paractinoplanes lichenicola]|uniref:4-oxalomesaconate tautomerase n=1 Tax=Paractinoplanes lichenicola TaxID=2802976 RepID=A0ABS1VW61_9ACTN|nr:PrpF domain-containing protein [Actinoplanes lichenicola]MBL7258725.1 4-oxalomesaconate tautomerase [Actinoplanes lichenicola]